MDETQTEQPCWLVDKDGRKVAGPYTPAEANGHQKSRYEQGEALVLVMEIPLGRKSPIQQRGEISQ